MIDGAMAVPGRKRQGMIRLRSLTIALSALCVVFFVVAVAASAAKPQYTRGKRAKTTGARLDKSFGRGGFATAPIAGNLKPIRMALAPDGRVYALQNSQLVAFEPDGSPTRNFGDNGRVKFVSDIGTGEPESLTVDSRGRVLVSGSVYVGNDNRIGPPDPGAFEYHPVNNAFVIRLLPNGNRDLTFGSGGEVETDFGLPRPSQGVEYEKPSVRVTSIAVDEQDRPILGGGYVASFQCALIGGAPAPFVARLTTSGGLDTRFAGKGYSTIDQVGEVKALAQTPGGGAATLSSGQSCGPRYDETPSIYSAFTGGGEASPSLDPGRPSFFMDKEIAVDSKGRILVLQTFGLFTERAPVLVRLLPTGAVDTTFGHGGGFPLRAGGALTVDARNRPIVASGFHGINLMRLRADGKIDSRFGSHGVVTAQAGVKGGGVDAVALDRRGRIYTARTAESKNMKIDGLQIGRFLPGR